LFYHIGTIKGKDSVFQIGNIFPVTEKYIKKAFTIQGQPYIVKDITLRKALHSKSMKFLSLVQQGKLTPNLDIIALKQILLDMFLDK